MWIVDLDFFIKHEWIIVGFCPSFTWFWAWNLCWHREITRPGEGVTRLGALEASFLVFFCLFTCPGDLLHPDGCRAFGLPGLLRFKRDFGGISRCIELLIQLGESSCKT